MRPRWAQLELPALVLALVTLLFVPCAGPRAAWAQSAPAQDTTGQAAPAKSPFGSAPPVAQRTTRPAGKPDANAGLFERLSFWVQTKQAEYNRGLVQAVRRFKTDNFFVAAGALAFLSFLYVMVLSLAFLAPELSTKMLSMFMLMFSLILLGNAIWVMRRGQQQPGGFERFLRRRYVMTGFVAGVAIVSAVQCLLHPKPSWLNNFGFIIAIMLVNAASISWDLLVQVGRLKLAHERKRPE